LQKLLSPETALVSYFIEQGQARETLYTFVITKRGIEVFSKPLPANTDKMIRGFTNALLYNEPFTFHKAGNALSSLLKPRLSNSIKDVVIISTGKFSTIPFEALPWRVQKDGRSFPKEYWLNHYSIGYDFSSTLLLQKAYRKAPDNSSIFLCAPIEFERVNLNSLPGTEAEVNTIAGLFGQQALLKKSTEATETVIKEANLKSFKYLHFATHGVVDEDSPELSCIFLKESAVDDGNLFSGEIFNLNLNADLVALSACQTGLGKISKGEGVIGLSRALVYAGARNVMVSYWPVADESTSQLMTGFYTNMLKSGSLSYRNSLRQVKLDMIARGQYSAPYYWAPFVLIGF
jgi:CHAT domain-containing protein